MYNNVTTIVNPNSNRSRSSNCKLQHGSALISRQLVVWVYHIYFSSNCASTFLVFIRQFSHLPFSTTNPLSLPSSLPIRWCQTNSIGYQFNFCFGLTVFTLKKLITRCYRTLILSHLMHGICIIPVFLDRHIIMFALIKTKQTKTWLYHAGFFFLYFQNQFYTERNYLKRSKNVYCFVK